MKKNLFSKILVVFGLLISLGLPNFLFAQACPIQTTVTGTIVTFVGELTDMGGDTITYAWFEYGKTSALGQKTSEKTLTQTGIYCLTFSGLESSTTYYYRAAARNSAGTSYGEIKTFTTTPEPGVDMKANNSDGPITIPFNTSANLTWVTSNVTSCTASGSWTGSKALSGSESTGNLTSSKTYTLNCTGPRGSASDSVTVNVSGSPTMRVEKLVRNLSDETNWLKSVSADPSEAISFKIEVKAENSPLSNVTVKDNLPERIINLRNLKIDGVPSAGDIKTGLNIGNLAQNQTKTITFDADLAGSDQFPFGQTILTNSVTVYATNVSNSDTAQIIVSKRAVAGAVTAIPTGLSDYLLTSFWLTVILAWFLLFIFFLYQRSGLKIGKGISKMRTQIEDFYFGLNILDSPEKSEKRLKKVISEIRKRG